MKNIGIKWKNNWVEKVIFKGDNLRMEECKIKNIEKENDRYYIKAEAILWKKSDIIMTKMESIVKSN